MNLKLTMATAILLLLSGCKSSEQWAEKYARKNPNRYKSLTTRFIRTGGCKADTVTQTTVRDSIAPGPLQVVHDTLHMSMPAICNLDTTLPNGTRIAISNGSITVSVPVETTVRYRIKTVEHTVRDLAAENVLREDSAKLQWELIGKTAVLKDREALIKEQSARITRLQWRFWGTITLLAIICLVRLYLKLKPKFL